MGLSTVNPEFFTGTTVRTSFLQCLIAEGSHTYPVQEDVRLCVRVCVLWECVYGVEDTHFERQRLREERIGLYFV